MAMSNLRDAAARPPSMSAIPLRGERGEPARRLRVLVVDDQPGVLETLRAVLEADFDVETESSPVRALEKAATGAFDVVCTDFSMPGMDGGQLFLRVRQLRPAVGCIIATATPDKVPQEVRLSPDMIGVVEKPVPPARLIKLIEQIGRLTEVRRGIEGFRK
jgi:CheY-like chemotaxis protein